MYRRIIPVTILLVVAACNQSTQQAAPIEAVASADYGAALSHPDRRAGDSDRDQSRKPDKVLAFFGVEPGMTVLDLFSGGGYYSELISYVVGPEGGVVSHTNSAYLNFVGEEFEARHGGGRLANVEVLMAENNELVLPAGAFDAVTLILTYHDIFYVDPDNGWPKIDGPKLLAEIYKSMKPGAVLGIVDHYAEAGSPRETGNSVHRIDPGIVISELETAGFMFDGKSNILRNMDDDYSKIVIDPAIRGKTDRFVLRFRRPE